MQDKQSLKQRLEEVTKEANTLWEAMQAREKELQSKRDEWLKQVLVTQNLKAKRKKNTHSGLWKLFHKSQIEKNQELLKKLDEEIETANQKTDALREEARAWNKVYEDPEYKRLSNIWSPLYNEKTKLEEMLSQLELQELVGINNLFVFADTANACTYGSRGHVSVSMKIDGTDRGYVATPISVVPLSNGIHSISFALSFSGGELYTKELQFSLQGNNRFVIIDKINCSTAISNSGADINKYDKFEDFIDKARLRKSDVINFFKKL